MLRFRDRMNLNDQMGDGESDLGICRFAAFRSRGTRWPKGFCGSDLCAGRNIELLQLVTVDDIGRVISEFLDNRIIVEKSDPEEEIPLMAAADLFASLFGFKQD